MCVRGDTRRGYVRADLYAFTQYIAADERASERFITFLRRALRAISRVAVIEYLKLSGSI